MAKLREHSAEQNTNERSLVIDIQKVCNPVKTPVFQLFKPAFLTYREKKVNVEQFFIFAFMLGLHSGYDLPHSKRIVGLFSFACSSLSSHRAIQSGYRLHH